MPTASPTSTRLRWPASVRSTCRRHRSWPRTPARWRCGWSPPGLDQPVQHQLVGVIADLSQDHAIGLDVLGDGPAGAGVLDVRQLAQDAWASFSAIRIGSERSVPAVLLAHDHVLRHVTRRRVRYRSPPYGARCRPGPCGTVGEMKYSSTDSPRGSWTDRPRDVSPFGLETRPRMPAICRTCIGYHGHRS